jgi:hypothetical protein
MVTSELAAKELDARLRENAWYLSTGVGETRDGKPALYVYVKTARHRELTQLRCWMGFPVMIRAIGSIKPLTALSNRISA